MNQLVDGDRVNALAYIDRGVFDEEIQRIFHDGWVFVGHESEISEPGDFVARKLAGDPYLMLRDREGTVQVLANKCSHRGTQLVQGQSGSIRSMQCIFHGWSFGLDGTLKGVPQPGGMMAERADCDLARPGQVGSYRGFVFANLSGSAGSLEDHLADGGRFLLDWACDLSPSGELDISAGWLGQESSSNWKMWAESDLDGYHLGILHSSLWRAAPGSQYETAVFAGENVVTSTTRDRGNGHVELEFWRGYDRELAWLGVDRERVQSYVDALVEARGPERAEELLWRGPPHALIFPNLFLGEMNLAIIEPIAADRTVHHHTPLTLAGVEPSFNQRVLRQSEAAMGPAGFLLPDDAAAAERMQAAYGRTGGLFDISRGRAREVVEDNGDVVGHVSDEVPNRGFWHRWQELMPD